MSHDEQMPSQFGASVHAVAAALLDGARRERMTRAQWFAQLLLQLLRLDEAEGNESPLVNVDLGLEAALAGDAQRRFGPKG